MLAECRQHGYYRGETCPFCAERGRFLMNDRELNSLGRIMAGVLRHFPDKIGVNMDGHGWVDIEEFVDAVGDSRSGFHWLKPHHIEAIALSDPKGRYQIDGGMIRATYGHTVVVNLDDLPLADRDILYYPVSEEELDIILENGLNPVDRKMVHLSGSMEKALEAGHIRIENPILLEIDVVLAKTDGVEIYRAGRDVYIADVIDAKYITKVDNVQSTPDTDGVSDSEESDTDE